MIKPALALLALGCSSTLLANLGAPISEPGLQGRSDIVYFQDFEGDGDAWKQSAQINKPYLRPSSHVAFKGSKSLQTKFAKGHNTPATWPSHANHYGGTLQFRFAHNGLEEPEEIYFRYYLYIPGETGEFPFPDRAIWNPKAWKMNRPDYHPEKHGALREVEKADKMPGFAGIYADTAWGGAGRGGKFPDGTNGWSARMKIEERGDQSGYWDIAYYVYHLEAGISGKRSTWLWNASLSRQTWHCIEGYVQLNTLSETTDDHERDPTPHKNGILRGWVDGRLAFEKTDLVFRHVERLKIEEIYGNFYIGGNWFPIVDCYLFTDNWVVASNQIGSYRDYPSSIRNSLSE